MLVAFQHHVTTHFPNFGQERFLLACSGGMDSMVLTHLCKASKFDFVLAHCNFQLRGNDSDADEEFVARMAAEYQVSFYATRFNTESYSSKKKVSVQMAARTLRYQWFDEIMVQNSIKTLVTAHHADDNLETFLINLSRGTGINGLAGIPAKTDIIARPLLPFSRKEIEDYANANRLEWREDESNKETKYLRNKIRHDIIPQLKALHPTFLENFKLTQSHLQNTSALVSASIETIRTNIFQEKDGLNSIKIKDLERLHPLRPYLYELFKEYGFTAWDDIKDLLSATSGKEVHSKTHRLIKDRNKLLLTKIEAVEHKSYQIKATDHEITTPISLQFEEVSSINEHGSEVLYVDKKTLKYPLTVRKWKNGDYFHPLGMRGKKKLSKYFKDEKIDVLTKNKQWLLCSEGRVVWVIDRRGDDRFKVTDETKNIMKISLNK